MSTLLKDYPTINHAYPEMIAPDGTVRPHWAAMLKQLESYGPEQVDILWRRAQRILHENGVTYNVYGDPKGMNRPWALDPIPLIIPPEEWETITAGLTQRADVLNRMLADIYGEQTLLHNNVLPSDVIFGNRAFLRPCSKLQIPDNLYLTMHAVDLVRTPTGNWCVLEDRTQTPSGAGYALENRLIISRTFQTLFRDYGVERLASFFLSLRERLEQLAGTQHERPLIVILTSGPTSESYFEHAYLARYLGFPLVQGNDLTVRENKVFLKTLAGLKQVHVIVRRQRDVDCDPLEMDGQSAPGIPGLVQAAAAGHVVIANALGSGLAQTPALLPFFPTICRNLLNEEPLLQTIPTLWCGQHTEMETVITSLERWVIKSAFPGEPLEPVFGSSLSPDERTQWIENIKAAPQKYIAQENTRFSMAPSWKEGRFTPRPLTLRAFIVSGRDGWKVMSGGLVRTSPNPDTTDMTLERGGGSKDAWVLASGDVSTVSLLPREGSAVEISRDGGNLPSRIADNFIWLGRYIQRADYQTRMVRTILRRLTEESMPDGNPELPELLRTLAILTDVSQNDAGTEEPIANLEQTKQLISKNLFDPNESNNLYQALTIANQIGYSVRDRISLDTWQILDRLQRELHSTSPESDLSDTLAMLDRLLMPLSAFSGLVHESMTHGYGWHLMDMGFRLERTVMSAQILREMLVAPVSYEPPIFEAILEVACSSMTYRNRYQSRAALLPLLDLLIADASNPRSIAFQLHLIRNHIEELSHLPHEGNYHEQELADELLQFVETINLPSLEAVDKDGTRNNLSQFLDTIIEHVQEISSLITQRYLAHTDPTCRLAPLMGNHKTGKKVSK